MPRKKRSSWVERRPVPSCQLGVLHAFGPGRLQASNHMLEFKGSECVGGRRLRAKLSELKLVCIYGSLIVTPTAIRLITDAGAALVHLSSSGMKANGITQPATQSCAAGATGSTLRSKIRRGCCARRGGSWARSSRASRPGWPTPGVRVEPTRERPICCATCRACSRLLKECPTDQRCLASRARRAGAGSMLSTASCRLGGRCPVGAGGHRPIR